jgi:hypothetical protein
MSTLTILASLTLLTLTAGVVLVQDKPKRFTHPMPKDPENAMARWMATMKPGPAHERLGELLGKYEMTMRMYMGGPNVPPMELKGESEVSWLVNGKWLQSKYSGIGLDGKPMTSTWILGYDNFKERYVMVMLDSMQTCMNTAMGHFDQSGDNLILWGTIDEPMTPEQDKMVKYVFRGFGKDSSTFEVHDMMIGETNTKVVEIAAKRTK